MMTPAIGLSAESAVSQPPEAGKKQGMAHRPEIDGLRALAVLPVILFHAGLGLFGGGYVGGDVFFVISGFLITTIIVSEHRTGTFSIVRFYERRARRILPALFFVMTACLPAASLWLLPHEAMAFGKSLISVSVFMSNVLFWRTSRYFVSVWAWQLEPALTTREDRVHPMFGGHEDTYGWRTSRLAPLAHAQPGV